jgi:hypothetical protein
VLCCLVFFYRNYIKVTINTEHWWYDITAQTKPCVSVRKTGRLMLYRETVRWTLYLREHTTALCGQTAEVYR